VVAVFNADFHGALEAGELGGAGVGDYDYVEAKDASLLGTQRAQRRSLGRSLVAVVPPLRGPTRRTAARKKKSGRSGRDDRKKQAKRESTSWNDCATKTWIPAPWRNKWPVKVGDLDLVFPRFGWPNPAQVDDKASSE